MNFYPQPYKIVRQGPATICWFEDGTKSVVRLQDGDEDDIYNAVCIAIAKRYVGSGSAIKRLVNMVEDTEKSKANRQKNPKYDPAKKRYKYHLPFMPFCAEELFAELFDELNERSQ